MPAIVLMFLSSPLVSAQDESADKARVEALVRTNVAGGVERIDIFRLPKFYESIKQIQPDDVETLWRYKMTIRELLPPKQELIAGVMRTANIHRSGRTWDLRWGIIFYGSRDTRIAALNFDETGHYGSVDKIPISFGPDFFRRLKAALHLSID